MIKRYGNNIFGRSNGIDAHVTAKGRIELLNGRLKVHLE